MCSRLGSSAGTEAMWFAARGDFASVASSARVGAPSAGMRRARPWKSRPARQPWWAEAERDVGHSPDCAPFPTKSAGAACRAVCGANDDGGRTSHHILPGLATLAIAWRAQAGPVGSREPEGCRSGRTGRSRKPRPLLPRRVVLSRFVRISAVCRASLSGSIPARIIPSRAVGWQFGSPGGAGPRQVRRDGGAEAADRCCQQGRAAAAGAVGGRPRPA
jgi:hypothetical protein